MPHGSSADIPAVYDLGRWRGCSGARPVFNPLVVQFIPADYTDGTQEWNMVFEQCPSGWVQVFTRQWMV
jgi:hypothetical protein